MSLILEADGNGDLFVKPIIQWATYRAPGNRVLLAVEYLERKDAAAVVPSEKIPLILTPLQAQELAEALNKAAQGTYSDHIPVSLNTNLK